MYLPGNEKARRSTTMKITAVVSLQSINQGIRPSGWSRAKIIGTLLGLYENSYELRNDMISNRFNVILYLLIFYAI